MLSLNLNTFNSASVSDNINVINNIIFITSTLILLKKKFSFKVKQAFSAWRDLKKILKKIFKHSRVFFNIKEAMDRYSALKLEIRIKNTRISAMQLSNKI